MFVTCYSWLCNRRRRRDHLLNIILIIFGLYLIFRTKYNDLHFPSTSSSIHNISLENKLFNQTLFNCSGDPVEKWCREQITSFSHSTSTTRHRKRTGGESIQDVLNQPETDEYFHFNKGFIKLPCDISALDGSLPGDHLSSIFATATSYDVHDNVRMISDTTVAVTRRDYVNIYHTVTDLYTVFLLCRFFRADPKSVHILFLDAHPTGSLDMLWSQLFHSYTRLGHLKNVSSVGYKQLIWAQPQSRSELNMKQRRKIAPSFFFSFRDHVLKQFNAQHPVGVKVDCRSLNVFFLVRHNYVAHPRNPSGVIGRQLSNEKQILDDLKKKLSIYPALKFSTGHFEELTMEEQLKIIAKSDVFIGMHGAGLTHVLFMKASRALIELTTSTGQPETHFEFLAAINAVYYRNCSIDDEKISAAGTIFDCIRKKVSEMCPSIFLSRNNSSVVITRLV